MEAPVLKVVWKNPLPPVELVHHTCVVCGKSGGWVAAHRFPVGDGYEGYEHAIGVCSDRCEHVVQRNHIVAKEMIRLNRQFYEGKKMPKFIYDLIKKWEDECANAAIV